MAEMKDYSVKTQDCNAITRAFERGLAYNNDEPSVQASMTRHVQNTKFFATAATKSLNSYKTQPALALANQTGKPDSAELSGMKIGNQFITVPTNKSSSILSRAVKECIPCDFRILHGLDLNPVQGLLAALKADVKSRLGILDDLKNLLSNIDIYGDFCQMASFLNFMCVPDLQRMLVILMAMMMDFSAALLTLNGLLQALLAPFFTPLLMSINNLLDQLVQLVLSPLTCIMSAIEQDIRKLDIGALFGDETLGSARKAVNVKKQQVVLDVQKFQGEVRTSLMELHTMLNQGDKLIRNKLNFYTQQITQLLGQWGQYDTSAVAAGNQKIICLRLVGLIRAMIKAKSLGSKLCQENHKPSTTELDNFFSTYVSPNSQFNISVDPSGNLQLSPKIFQKTIPTGITTTAQPLLTPPPEVKTIKCRLNTSSDDVNKVNLWIAELNQT